MKLRYIFLLTTITAIGVLFMANAGEKTESTDTANKIYDTAIQKMQIKGFVLSTMEDKVQDSYYTMATIGVIILCGWLLLVIIYFVWAIRRYTINFGLSGHEWKVINPDLYAKEGEERTRYKKIHNANTAIQTVESIDPNKTSNETESARLKNIKVPEENPYRYDSFGLPPGTIRGVMALTTLVAFIIIECVNLFAPTNLEKDFSELLMVFEMVIAFYFGARAVEMFRKKKSENEETAAVVPPVVQPTNIPEIPQKPVGEGPVPTEAKPPSFAPIENTAGIAELPNEQPAFLLKDTTARMANILPLIIKNVLPEKKAKSAVEKTPLEQRILALTSSFETGMGFPDCFSALSGNFDNQGLSFGALQWCFGQKTLQPIFSEMVTNNESIVVDIFGNEKTQSIKTMLSLPLKEQVAWANALQITDRKPNGVVRYIIAAEWKDAFHQLGQTKEMIAIQTKAAALRLEKAKMNCTTYKLPSERGLALMFDINVQNGHVDKNGSGTLILKDYQTIENQLSGDELEVERMRIVAKRRAEVVNPKWAADVFKRKLTIAEGKGSVHGKTYDLATQYNITLQTWRS